MQIKFTKEHFIDSRTHAVGEVIDLDEKRATQLVKADVAVPSMESVTLKVADAKQPENLEVADAASPTDVEVADAKPPVAVENRRKTK